MVFHASYARHCQLKMQNGISKREQRRTGFQSWKWACVSLQEVSRHVKRPTFDWVRISENLKQETGDSYSANWAAHTLSSEIDKVEIQKFIDVLNANLFGQTETADDGNVDFEEPHFIHCRFALFLPVQKATNCTPSAFTHGSAIRRNPNPFGGHWSGLYLFCDVKTDAKHVTLKHDDERRGRVYVIRARICHPMNIIHPPNLHHVKWVSGFRTFLFSIACAWYVRYGQTNSVENIQQVRNWYRIEDRACGAYRQGEACETMFVAERSENTKNTKSVQAKTLPHNNEKYLHAIARWCVAELFTASRIQLFAPRIESRGGIERNFLLLACRSEIRNS